MQLRGFSYGISKPAGTVGQVQWNDGTGKFGADSGLVYTPATKSLTIGGATLTADAPGLSITQTWNNSGVEFGALKVNVIHLNSSGNSSAIQTLDNGTLRFCVRRNGGIYLGAGANGNAGIYAPSYDTIGLMTATRYVFYAAGGSVRIGNAFSPISFGFVNGSADGTPDVLLYRDDVGILAQRNGAAAQMIRIYNNYTDASNNARADIGWASNLFKIDVTKSGTGVQRTFQLRIGGTTAITVDTSAATYLQDAYISGATFAATNNAELSGFRHAYYSSATLVDNPISDTNYGRFYVGISGTDMAWTHTSTPTAGRWMGIKVGSAMAGAYFRINANVGQKIRLSSGVTASGGYIRSNVAHSFVLLIWDSVESEWVAWQQSGTWTIDS